MSIDELSYSIDFYFKMIKQSLRLAGIAAPTPRRPTSTILHSSLVIPNVCPTIFRIPTSKFRIPSSPFVHPTGIQPENSYSSSFAFKTDGHRFSFDNNRHFAGSIGIRQHGFKMPCLFDHIKVIYPTAVFGKCCTSCPGIRSGILTEDQDLIRHFPLLIAWRI